MLILKLNLPEATVSYNRLGKMTSAPVPYTPDCLRGIQMDLEVTGYVADTAFFAFKLKSAQQPLTLHEQFTLLAKLGFKTVPVHYYPQVPGSVDSLIHQKARYSEYSPVWWDVAANAEYSIPELTTINDVDWALDSESRLVRRLTTDLGVFDVVDHRAPEYYQVGLRVKVDKGRVGPYMTGPIVDPTPVTCPKCNNPLRRYQLGSDLPLILKCKAPLCRQLVWDKKLSESLPPEEDSDSESFRNEDNSKDLSNKLIVESENSTDSLKIINLECEFPDDLLKKITGKVVFVSVDESDKEPPIADYILTKTKMSVTKRSRTLSKTTGIPLLPLAELEAKLDE